MKTVLKQAAAALVGLAMGLGAVAPGMAHAAFPERPIRLIVGVPPGGGADMVARLLAEALHKELGQAIIVENRPGAGGNIAASEVARSQPDGYTLLLANSSHAINPSLYPKLPFDSVKDFMPISQVTANYFFLAVRPDLPADSLGGLVKLAKESKSPLSYASAGVGQGAHLGMALLVHEAGFEAVHVPFSGIGPAAQALLGGHVDMALLTPSSALPYAQAKKLRLLAVTAPQRVASMPDVPTVAESGYPGFEANNWQGVLAPAHTPAETIAIVQRALVQALKRPEVVQQLAANGTDAVSSTPEAFGEFLKSEAAKWGKVVKQVGATVN